MDVCIISALLKRSFSSRGLQDQREMIKKGRPTPDLAITQKNKSFTRRFHLREYEATKWLAGSAVTNRLYCWPCLLFNPLAVGSLCWTKEGYSDLKNIKSAIDKHQTSANPKIRFISKKRMFAENIGAITEYACHPKIGCFNIEEDL